MIDTSQAADLMSRFVLFEGEELGDIEQQGDEIAVTTSARRFVLRSEGDTWLFGHEDWVDDVIVAHRTDQNIHGQKERFALLFVNDADDAPVVYVNDKDAVAALGRRLTGGGLNPIAYAELLVQFHPYSSARRTVLVNSDDLRTIFQIGELPDVEPLRTQETPEGLALTFTSCVVYRPPGSSALLDLYDWEVVVPNDGPAGWDSDLTTEGIPLITTPSV